ncbi:hypothetical protein D3C76_982730 [compost metagenome]
MVALVPGADNCQTQKRRLAQIEPTLTLTQSEGTQCVIHAHLTTHVILGEWRSHALAHNLYCLAQIVLPDEIGAQNIVGVHRTEPGLLESLGIQAFYIHAHLVDVMTTALLVQCMEQHTLLHRRKRIDIGNQLGSHWQIVQLRLGQAAEREVRRGNTSVLCITAVGNQCPKFLRVVIGQSLNGSFIELFPAEVPTQFQLTAVHLPVKRQQATQRGLGVLRGAGILLGGYEQP